MEKKVLFRERGEADNMLSFEVEVWLANQSEMKFPDALGLWFGGYHASYNIIIVASGLNKA